MAKFLRDLLDAKEPIFSNAIDQLEQASHRQGQDVRLVGEIKEKSVRAMHKLGLDPTDTTGPELYQALIAKIKQHDDHLARSIGGDSAMDVVELMPLMKKAVDAVKMPRDCWVLKRSVARDMLRKMPPPNIMKRLNHTSIDSMLKHEDLSEIYGALRFAESSDWLREFNTLYTHLKPSDFETRAIEIVVMDPNLWGDVAEKFVKKKRHNITHLKELGVILMVPVTVKHLPGITTWDLSLLFHYTNEIRLYSTFFKLQQVKKDFGDILVNTLNADPDLGPILAGQTIHWRVIQRYFGKLEGSETHPEIFEPHVHPEDLHWRHAEEMLYKIDPELEFWKGMDYVATLPSDGRPLTFNMMDVAASYCNSTPYAKREIYHFRESLWNEIFARYLSQKTLEDQVLRQLDNSMINPLDLAASKY